MSAIRLFPAPIGRYLSDFVAHGRRVQVARALLVAMALSVAWMLAVAGVDRFVPLPPWARAALLGALLLAVAGLVARPLVRLFRRDVNWIDAAQQVERRNTRLGQRLVTVTSQLLAPVDYRGSEQMLATLVEQVSGDVARPTGRRLADWAALARPGLAVLCLAAATVGLWNISWLNLPQLIDRQLHPLAGILPVSTTQIELSPGGASVKEHEPLQVRVVVRRNEDGRPPILHVSSDDKRWDETPMTSGADNAFVATIPLIEQDLHYYVTAGDARTPSFPVRVLRRPVVAEFRIRYAYPAYTGRSALSVKNTDGLVEAPQSSEATISVVATEPLESAVLKIDGKRLEMSETSQRNVRQAQITVTRDQPYTLEMTSDRGVEGRGPAGMRIRAVADRPPLVRLVQPATDLRLSPREIVPLAYQALDDYAVAQLIARAQVNANPPVNYALRLRGDARRIEGAFELDLATLNVNVGDVVSITVVAHDKPGQTGSSDVRHILISPRSIDVATHQRLAELAQAADYAHDWSMQLAAALKAVEHARKVDPQEDAEKSAAFASASRHLSTAEETGTMLRQSLLRVIVYSASPKMSEALATAVDTAAVELDGVDRVDETIASTREVKDATAGRMTRVAAEAAELARQVKKLSDGDQAAAVQADRENLKPSPSTAPTDRAAQDRRREMFERATQDINAALTALGIDPKAGDVDAQLQRRIDSATRIISAAKPIDFTAAAQRWSEGVRGNEFQPPHLEDRLSAASQAEAVRPDAEMNAARDLQYASRAAAKLSAPVEDEEPAPAEAKARVEALGQYPTALGALRAEHEVNRRALEAKSPREVKQIHEAARAIHTAAAAARAKMMTWAAPAGTSSSELASKARELDNLAVSAGVATENKDFDTAAEMDRRLAAALGRPELAEASAVPRAIDRLSNNQEKLADQTAQADETQAAAIAGVQQQVADDIGQTQVQAAAGAQTTPDSAEARQKATEAISRAQEKLASLPMQLLTVQELAANLGDATTRLSLARAHAAEAPPAQRETAQRVAAMIQSEVEQAQKSFDDASKPLTGPLADDLVDSLRQFAPDTTGAVTAVDEDLRGTLSDLQDILSKSAESRDRAGIEAAAQQVRDALAEVQEALRDAQGKVIERDPLVSARWFARAAADALSAAPPNKRSAAAHQKKTLEALSKAAVEALRRSKNARLSQAPGYAPFYLPPLPGAWDDSEGRPSGDRLLQTIPGLREWGRLRERMGESLDAPVRESEPAGYSESLRLYFEVLGREDARPRDASKP
jgi:hypothetical protein